MRSVLHGKNYKQKRPVIMSNRLVFEWRVDGANPPAHVRDEAADALQRVRGRTVRMTLELVDPPASGPQKRYYRGVVLPRIHLHMRGAGTFATIEDVHTYLKKNIGGLERVDLDGEVHLASVRDLSRPEMTQYLEAVLAWAAEHGIPIPAPTKEPDYDATENR